MIRHAQVADAAGLANLLRALTDDLPRFAAEPPELTLGRVTAALTNEAAAHTLLVTEDGGALTGFIHAMRQPSLLHSGGEGFVSALFIRPEERGRNLGRALLAAIEGEARARGCSRLSLLNMRQRPSYGRGFYAGLGWRERPEAANFVLELGGS